MPPLVSVMEVVREYVTTEIDVETVAPGGVHIGGVEDAADLRDGAIIISPAGQAKTELYVDIHNARVEVRSVAKQIALCDDIGNALFPVFERNGRQIFSQPSTGETFLCHTMTVAGGPTLIHDPDTDTWLKVMFVELMIGTEPCP